MQFENKPSYRTFDHVALLMSPVFILQVYVAVVNGTFHGLLRAFILRQIRDQPLSSKLIQAYFIVSTSQVKIIFLHAIERTAETASLILQWSIHRQESVVPCPVKGKRHAVLLGDMQTQSVVITQAY